MPEPNISEASTVQMPMARHAAEAGWTPVAPEGAPVRRGGTDGLLFRRELDNRCAASSRDDRRSVGGVIERLGSQPPTIEANRQMLNGCEESDDGGQNPKPVQPFQIAPACRDGR